MANLTILRTYALKDPAELPASVVFSSSEKTMTVFDAYPKSIFHFLVLPRVLSPPASTSLVKPSDKGSNPQTDTHALLGLVTPPPSVTDLSSLRALLNSTRVGKEQAKEVILSLKEDAMGVKAEIEQEMEKRFGFKWDIWIGFHGAPSMEHMHLHVLSADLCSDRMKNKKHYSSFHPKLGFFLHVDEVLSWFDAEPSHYRNMAKLQAPKYEVLLKEPLVCFHCDVEKKNMPTLKAHLQGEWDKLKERVESRKKRKLESHKSRDVSSSAAVEGDDANTAHKKPRTDKS